MFKLFILWDKRVIQSFTYSIAILFLKIRKALFQKFSHFCFSIITLLGLNLSVRSETITLSPIVEGATPTDLGYNLAHFNLKGDAADWFRYSGVKSARMFFSASELQSRTSPGKRNVVSQASFDSVVSTTRANGTSSSTTIYWSDYNYDYESNNGSNVIQFKDTFTTLRAQGVELLVNITCSPSVFPLNGETDYGNKWEIWQHYYAQAYLLCRDYNIHRFSVFNEPNNWSGLTESDWLLRLRICSDAIQAAVTDVNTKFNKTLVSQIYAPNTASGKEKYNTPGATWGSLAVANRHLRLNGATDPNWMLFHFYNYQKYSALTNDSGSLSGYIDDITALTSYLRADMGTESLFPLVITEFNVRTGDSYDGKTNTQDTPEDYVALGANCIALTQNKASQLFLFKFGQTETTSTTYGLAKNGTHYVDNSSSDHNYGGATKVAEVYRLFVKAAQGGRARFSSSATSGAISTSTSGLWRLVTWDPESGNYYVYLANKRGYGISLDLNVASLGIPEGNPVLVEEVSTSCSGGIRSFACVKNGVAALGTIPPQGVWLVTLSSTALKLSSIAATEDTQLTDGISKADSSGGTQLNLQCRSDGTINGRSAILVKIPFSFGVDAKSVLLDLGIANSNGENPIQVHVYGVNYDSWSESSAWSSLGTVLKQGTVAGSKIANNVAINTGSSPACQILGQLIVNSSTSSRKMLDVTDFVKNQTDGVASFLIVQDHRWDFSAEPLSTRTSGDIQSAGVTVISREKTQAGPRLIALRASSIATPPVLLSNPRDQFLKIGDPFALSILTDGTSPVTYQWKKDGVNISGATSANYNVAGCAISDIGSYAVEVTNSAGTTLSSTALITINASPTLVSAPVGGSFYVGDSILLSAEFTGYPAPTYQWSRNGVNIPNATGSTYAFTPTSTAEGGTYTVTASNTAGTGSASALVNVLDTPTSFINISSTGFSYLQNFNTLAKTYGNTVSGSTFASWADGAVVGAGWYANTDLAFLGYRTANDNKSDISRPPTSGQTGLLSLGTSNAESPAERALGGIPLTSNKIYFALRLRNGVGQILDGGTLSFSMEEYSFTTLAKKNTTLSVDTLVSRTDLLNLKEGVWVNQANYTPKATATSTYTLSDGNASSGNYKSTKSLVLTGLNIEPGQDLWIRFVLSTTSDQPVALGVDDLAFGSLTLPIPPSITSHPGNLVVNSGGVATFAVTASGSNPLSYQWRKNGVLIPGQTGSSLVLSSVRSFDEADYTVVVGNSAGSVTSNDAVLSVLFASAFEEWRDTAFGLDAGNVLISGPDADPDQDGASNRYEFVFGGNPYVSESNLITSIVSNDSFKIHFLRRKDPLSATYEVRFRSDLSQSFSNGVMVAPTPVAVQPIGIDAHYEEVEVVVPMSTPRGFFQIQATIF